MSWMAGGEEIRTEHGSWFLCAHLCACVCISCASCVSVVNWTKTVDTESVSTEFSGPFLNPLVEISGLTEAQREKINEPKLPVI